MTLPVPMPTPLDPATEDAWGAALKANIESLDTRTTAVETATAYAPAQEAMELWQRLRDTPDGPIPSPQTGQTLVPLVIPTGNEPAVATGAIRSTYTAGTSAWYLQTKLDNHVSRLGVRWTFTTATSTVGLIAWADDYGLHQTPSPVVPDSTCHLAINSTGWTYSVVLLSGTFAVLGSGTFDTPLATDGTTVHTAEVFIDRENGIAYVDMPDGSTVVVGPNPYIGLNTQSKWAVVEEYRANSAAGKVSILEWWADSQHSGEPLNAARARGRAPKLPPPTLANATTTTETAVASWKVPFGGQAAASNMIGKFFGQVSSTATLTYRLRIGPAATALTSRATVATFTTSAAGVANAHTSADFMIQMLTTGTSGTCTGGGTAVLAGATLGPATAAYAAATINTTVENFVTLSVVQSAAQTLTTRAADLVVYP